MAPALPRLPRGSAASSETSSPPVNPDLWRRYQTIVKDSRYRHFTRIPERIIRFLDSFQIEFDREAVHERLLAHYLFTAVVDDAIDSGEAGVAHSVFERLNTVAGPEKQIARASDVAIVTEMLKSHLDRDNRLSILHWLRCAHHEVIRERAAKSVGKYIEHRKALGRATAKQSYLLMRPALSEPNQKLCRMMEEIGAVGCLVDSMIDVRDDHQAGSLNFELTAVSYMTLCCNTAIAGLRVLGKKPSLILLLTEAVLDNIRDRGRASTSAIPQGESLCRPIAQFFRDSAARRL